jgi:beta-glucosidase
MHRIVVGLAAAATVLASLSLPESARAASPCGEPAKRPWCKTSLSADRRAALLLKAMTVDERI